MQKLHPLSRVCIVWRAKKHNLNKQKPEKSMIAKRETGKCQPGTKLKRLKAARTKLHTDKKTATFPHKE